MIPYGRQSIIQSDVDAVVEALQSDWLTQGPAVPRFEQALTEYVGAQGAVVVNSGTSALHIACLALGLSEGDLLWTSPISFVASANCGRYCGAEVDFVDVDHRTANICAIALAEKLAIAAARDRLPKVLVVVHLTGNPCDLAPIKKLLDRYGVKLIEDASHAIGARYGTSLIGSCQYSDITVFSFHPVKVITSAEGGAALSQNPSLVEKMRLFREHGIVKDAAKFQSAPEGDWCYEQQALGWNYRMTDLQAALGMSQLQRCDVFIEQRNKIANEYRDQLHGLPCETLEVTEGASSSYHLFVIKVAEQDRGPLFAHLRNSGIGVQVHYIPIHTQPYYRELGFDWGMFPVAEQYYRQAISLPIFPGLSDSEQNQVVDLLKAYWA